MQSQHGLPTPPHSGQVLPAHTEPHGMMDQHQAMVPGAGGGAGLMDNLRRRVREAAGLGYATDSHMYDNSKFNSMFGGMNPMMQQQRHQQHHYQTQQQHHVGSGGGNEEYFANTAAMSGSGMGHVGGGYGANSRGGGAGGGNGAAMHQQQHMQQQAQYGYNQRQMPMGNAGGYIPLYQQHRNLYYQQQYMMSDPNMMMNQQYGAGNPYMGGSIAGVGAMYGGGALGGVHPLQMQSMMMNSPYHEQPYNSMMPIPHTPGQYGMHDQMYPGAGMAPHVMAQYGQASMYNPYQSAMMLSNPYNMSYNSMMGMYDPMYYGSRRIYPERNYVSSVKDLWHF